MVPLGIYTLFFEIILDILSSSHESKVLQGFLNVALISRDQNCSRCGNVPAVFGNIVLVRHVMHCFKPCVSFERRRD